MPNLIITNACNLSCPFCFATEHLADGDARPAQRMTLEQYAHALAFCGTEEVRLCGGEPSVHPDIIPMIEMALEEPGRRVFIMTNGVWPRALQDWVAGRGSRDVVRLRYLFNILEPNLYTDAQWNTLLRTLECVHPLAATLGLTLFRAPMDCAHVLELARAYKVERVRFSVASPNTTDPGSWHLDAERDYPRLAPVVHRLVMDARAMGLKVHSDCGYIPPCFFTEEQRRDLRGEDGRHPPAMEWSCQGPVDMDAEGNAWRCYGLYNVVRSRVDAHASPADLSEDLERRTQELGRQHLLMDACVSCDWRARGQCMGGCFAYRVNRTTRSRAEDGLVRIGEDASLLGTTPTRNLVAVKELRGMGTMVLRDGTWEPLELDALERRAWDLVDGHRTVRDIGLALEADGTLRRAGPAVGRAVRKLYAAGALLLQARAVSSPPDVEAVALPRG